MPFMLGPEIFGVLLGLGEAGTFRGAGPIVGIAEWKKTRRVSRERGGDAGWWADGFNPRVVR